MKKEYAFKLMYFLIDLSFLLFNNSDWFCVRFRVVFLLQYRSRNVFVWFSLYPFGEFFLLEGASRGYIKWINVMSLFILNTIINMFPFLFFGIFWNPHIRGRAWRIEFFIGLSQGDSFAHCMKLSSCYRSCSWEFNTAWCISFILTYDRCTWISWNCRFIQVFYLIFSILSKRNDTFIFISLWCVVKLLLIILNGNILYT